TRKSPAAPSADTFGIMIDVDFDVAAHEEIEIAVVVEIQESGTSAEIRPVFPVRMSGQSRRGGDVHEPPASLAVADIMVKDIGLAVASQEDIGIAVVVDITNGNALAAVHVPQ